MTRQLAPQTKNVEAGCSPARIAMLKEKIPCIFLGLRRAAANAKEKCESIVRSQPNLY